MELKLVERNGVKWVEIRTLVSRGCNIQIFVGKEGWLNKQEYSKAENKPKGFSFDVSKYNIRWSQNNSAMMTFDDLSKIMKAIDKAKTMLEIEEET
jgi:hypothetical protein